MRLLEHGLVCVDVGTGPQREGDRVGGTTVDLEPDPVPDDPDHGKEGGAFKRSHLWDAESQITRSELPSLAEMVLDHTNDQSCTLEELEEHIEVANRTTMY